MYAQIKSRISRATALTVFRALKYPSPRSEIRVSDKVPATQRTRRTRRHIGCSSGRPTKVTQFEFMMFTYARNLFRCYSVFLLLNIVQVAILNTGQSLGLINQTNSILNVAESHFLLTCPQI